ncbi:MAG TPA: cell division protein CrgA [Acidimicrobiia bacterium]
MPESKRRKPKSRQLSTQTAQSAVRSKEPSPTWYVALMAGLMVLGVVLVLLRFVFEWPQTVLVAGLVAIAAGFLMTTNYR